MTNEPNIEVYSKAGTHVLYLNISTFYVIFNKKQYMHVCINAM